MRSLVMLVFVAFPLTAQDIPARWDELTASDWPKALEKSEYTCILPIGILEKHGQHAPIGSDLIHVREWAAHVTSKEYAVVFPDFFYGQVYEAKHQPGTFALPSRLVWELLDATCGEIARNGFKKIFIINGHGGNPYMLRYFIQTQLESRKEYAVYYYDPAPDEEYIEQMKGIRKSDLSGDMHAGENETSSLLYLRPDLVKLERAGSESGENQKRLSINNVYTGIWWYAGFPNHYAGEGEKASRELGKFMTDYRVESLVRALREVKADKATLELQKEFFDRVKGEVTGRERE